MKFLRSKKSQSQLTFIIIQLILLSVIGSALLMYTVKISKSTFYEKDFLSKDLSLTTSTILSAPGNIYYYYDLQVSPDFRKFDYLFQNHEAVIQEIIMHKTTSVKYLYPDSLFFKTISAKIKSPTTIIFENSGYDLKIQKESPDETIQKLKYPYVETKADIKTKKILIASGIKKDPVSNEPYTGQHFFTDPIASSFPNTEQIIQDIPLKSFYQFSEKDADLIIIINSISEPHKIKIYIPSSPLAVRQSRKLASLMLNPLRESYLSEDSAVLSYIFPVQSDLNTPAVYIAVSENLLKQKQTQNKILHIINDAVSNYYR